jgi:hypothetical protein
MKGREEDCEERCITESDVINAMRLLHSYQWHYIQPSLMQDVFNQREEAI